MQSSTYTALLGIPLGGCQLRLPGCHGLWLFFPEDSARFSPTTFKVPQPREDKSPRFRLVRVRSPLLAESLRFLFLGLLRCFTSPRVASPDYEFIRR